MAFAEIDILSIFIRKIERKKNCEVHDIASKSIHALLLLPAQMADGYSISSFFRFHHHHHSSCTQIRATEKEEEDNVIVASERKKG